MGVYVVCAIGAGRSHPRGHCPRRSTGTYERRPGSATGVKEGHGDRSGHRTVVVVGVEGEKRDKQWDFGEWEVEECVLGRGVGRRKWQRHK